MTSKDPHDHVPAKLPVQDGRPNMGVSKPSTPQSGSQPKGGAAPTPKPMIRGK